MFGQLQAVVGVNALQHRLTVVEVVIALAHVEVEDVDTEHLLHLGVAITAADVFGNGLCHTVDHALQVIELARLLNLNKDNLALRVLGLDIYAVILVILSLLVRLGVQQLHDGHFLLHQHRDQSLENGKVSLITKHVLRSPVESDVSVLSHNSCGLFACKDMNNY